MTSPNKRAMPKRAREHAGFEYDFALSSGLEAVGSETKPGPINAIPLDIMREIACYLRPLDLLQLSRLNRAWRGRLTSREASSHIWKAARATLQVPDCCEDLSEPEYASLLFEPNCQLCDQTTYKVDMALGRRLCDTCAREHIFANIHIDFKSKVPRYDYEETVLEIIPRSHVDTYEVRKKTGREGPYYFDLDVPAAALTMAQKRRALGSRMFQDWYQERVAFTDLATQHARIEQEWYNWWSARQCTARLGSLKQRFQALGYHGMDIHWPTDFNSMHVLIPLELHERDWETLRYVLEVEIIRNRDQRLAREARKHLAKRQHELHPIYDKFWEDLFYTEEPAMELPPMMPLYKLVFPTRANFFNFTSIRPLLDDLQTPITNADRPILEALKQETVDLLARIQEDLKVVLSDCADEDFPGLAETAIIKGLVASPSDAKWDGLYPRYDHRSPANPEVLLLEHMSTRSTTIRDAELLKAMNVLTCYKCRQLLHWPTLLKHEHIQNKMDENEMEVFQSSFQPLHWRTERSRPWERGLVTASNLGFCIMKGILKASGIDCRTATVVDLLGIGGFRCLCCPFMARNWKDFFIHFADNYRAETRAIVDNQPLRRQRRGRREHNPVETRDIAVSVVNVETMKKKEKRPGR